MNESTRAWNLLKPEERPDGVCEDGFATAFDPMGMPHRCADEFARDRLIVAVEDVLLRLGFWVYGPEDKYIWTRTNADHEDWRNPDRLKAANDALEAVRKDDDA